MPAVIVGRDALADRAWTTLREHGRVLLEGPAGIGKTAVLRALVDRAAAAGLLVASCAPAEAEATLPLAALADVLGPLAGSLDALAEPQRDAVRAAIDGTGEPVHERALAAGTLALLDAAANGHSSGLLVSVDDAPWLDPPSERALRFALRRLGGRVAVLVARRTTGTGPFAGPGVGPSAGSDGGPSAGSDGGRPAAPDGGRPAAPDGGRPAAPDGGRPAAPDGDQLPILVDYRPPSAVDHGAGDVPLGLDDAIRLAVTPLGAGPLHHLLAGHFGVSLSRPMVARLARDSGGNPLLAIELTRAVLRLPRRPGPGEDLPVPGSMQELVGASLAGLPAASVAAARYAALLAAPDLAALRRVGVGPAELDAVEEAGLVRVGTDDRVRFVHPVHAAAVRASIPPGVRRGLHARLAAVVLDPDERARQLGAATTAPDAAVAAELAAAARRARDRGAPELAAVLHEQAAGLAVGTPAREEQRLAAVLARYDTGDYDAAGALADALAADAQSERRADALLLRATIAFSADDPSAAVALAEAALAAAEPGSRRAGRIHAHLAVFVDLPGPARAHAEAALRLLPVQPVQPDRADGAATYTDPGADGSAGSVLAHGDDSLLASALMLLFLNEVRAGAPPRHEVLERALELEAGQPSWLAGTIPAIWWKGVDDHERSVGRLTLMLERAHASGEEPWQHEIVAHLGEAETLAGNYTAAAHWIERSRELAEQLATGSASENWLQGMLDVLRGELDAPAAAAERGLRDAARSGEPWAHRVFLHLAAFSALAAGRAGEAARYYAELAAAVDDSGLVEPLSTRFEGDWVEACVNAGDLETAARALARLAARHARLARPWTGLALARAQVLLAAADGRETAGPIADLLAARDAVPAGVVPFERARCLLVAGLAHRRARRRAAARETLLAAEAEFAALGADGFAARARDEAGRTGGRPAPSAALTSTEHRVAQLAARGHTNRMIADALFISPKTVEANLARVYRKLGISRRTELNAAVASHDTAKDRETTDSAGVPEP